MPELVLTPTVGSASPAELLCFSEYMRERFSMALLEMPPSEFTAPLGLAWMFRDIRELFLHLVAVEDQWIRGFVQGGPLKNWDKEWGGDGFPDAASVVRSWEAVRAVTREHLAAADDAEMARTITVPYHGKPCFTVRQVFMHLLVHEIHHRGQITAAMRMRGIAPPPSDFYDYVAEQLQ